MKDFSKIAVLAGLILLVVVVLNVVPGLHHWHFGGFGRALPWILFGFFWLWFCKCCSHRCCKRRCKTEEADVEETD